MLEILDFDPMRKITTTTCCISVGYKFMHFCNNRGERLNDISLTIIPVTNLVEDFVHKVVLENKLSEVLKNFPIFSESVP